MISSIGKQGKDYEKTRLAFIRTIDTTECSVLYCGRTIADKKGTVDHVLKRTGFFVHLKRDPRNLRWTCGEHNYLDSLSLTDRLELIKKMWGRDTYEWAMSEAGRFL